MAKIKSSNEIYDVIESALTDTPRAVTAVELMERPEVRRFSIAGQHLVCQEHIPA